MPEPVVKVTIEHGGHKCDFTIPLDGEPTLEWPLDVANGELGDILHLKIEADVPRGRFSGWRKCRS